jgi:putative transposase
MKCNPEIHHRRSIRLPKYDYSQPGVYFVTFCSYQKDCLFGEVKRCEIFLNEWGKLVENEWKRIPARFPDYQTGPFVIMPNHGHGILVNVAGKEKLRVGAGQKKACQTRIQPFAPPLRRRPHLGLVIGEFKATTTRLINGLRHTPGHPVWQRNYYEHIIRNEESYNHIAEYILTNPLKWESDALFIK